MRLPLLAAALLLSTPVFAQSPPAGATSPAAGAAVQPATPPAAAPATDLPSTPARVRHGRRTQAARFEEANTTRDGKLTLEQARAAHMNAVVRDFPAIDKTSKGYVRLADIRQHRREVRAARQASH